MADPFTIFFTTGKSTLCKILLSYAARLGWKPTLVDLDIGQGQISIPGTIAATLVDKPVDPVEGYEMEAPLVYFYGHVSPSENPDLYRTQVEQLAGMLERRFAGSAEYRNAGEKCERKLGLFLSYLSPLLCACICFSCLSKFFSYCPSWMGFLSSVGGLVIPSDALFPLVLFQETRIRCVCKRYENRDEMGNLLRLPDQQFPTQSRPHSVTTRRETANIPVHHELYISYLYPGYRKKPSPFLTPRSPRPIIVPPSTRTGAVVNTIGWG